MKDFRVFLHFFFSKYFQSLVILQISMIVSEKLRQNLSDYNQFLLKERFEVSEKRLFLVKK